MNILEAAYAAGCSLKRSYALSHRKRLPAKVLSVGNITTGGTGKTPAVIALAREAQQRGFRPCILTRGYRGKAKGPCLVHDGDKALMDAIGAGDEATLMADLLGDVPIVKGPDRYEAGIFALGALPRLSGQDTALSTLFILDDGFQHWRLCRDVDILLIDSTNPFGNGRLLPLGRLREELSEIGRADVVVLTKTDPAKGTASGLAQEVRLYNKAAPVFTSQHEPESFKTAKGLRMPLEALAGKRVIALCGIANPDAFRSTIEGLGAKLLDFASFRDHVLYSASDIRGILKRATELGADWIVTTEKDIMKLRAFDLPPNMGALHIEFRPEAGCFEEVFRRLQ